MNIVFYILVGVLAGALWYLMVGQFRAIGGRAYKMADKVKRNISDEEVEVRDEQR